MPDRWDEEWVEYRCVDCDPEYADDDEEDEAETYALPYVMLVPKGEAVPDSCPRCHAYLSLTEGAERLQITNTPYERWARAQEAKEATGP